jgi:DNA topoisomerase I
MRRGSVFSSAMMEELMPAAIAIGDVEQKAIDELGLRRIDASELTIERISGNDRFAYLRGGRRPVGRRDRNRIIELAIPPAWSEVRIAQDPDAHLQAVGRDDAGRLQYIYHSAWEDVRAAAKAVRLTQLGQALSSLRPAVEADLKIDGARLPLAVATRLVDLLHLRAGHESYAGDEGGRGVATLLKQHVKVDGASFLLRFRGKGGKPIEKIHTDAALAEALAALRAIRGPRLFKLQTEQGYRPMTASDLNAYLAETAGKPVTAKDFRTFYASATALNHLSQLGIIEAPTARRRALAEVARAISAELANTPAVVRKSYIHPAIVEKFERGELSAMNNSRTRAWMSAAESKLMRFFEASES